MNSATLATSREQTRLYRRAVEWIAAEDEPDEMHRPTVAAMVSVALVADIFGKDADAVARSVIRRRHFHPGKGVTTP
jgi:hypothetical protein